MMTSGPRHLHVSMTHLTALILLSGCLPHRPPMSEAAAVMAPAYAALGEPLTPDGRQCVLKALSDAAAIGLCSEVGALSFETARRWGPDWFVPLDLQSEYPMAYEYIGSNAGAVARGCEDRYAHELKAVARNAFLMERYTEAAKAWEAAFLLEPWNGSPDICSAAEAAERARQPEWAHALYTMCAGSALTPEARAAALQAADRIDER